jgi:hypothetical protein
MYPLQQGYRTQDPDARVSLIRGKLPAALPGHPDL